MSEDPESPTNYISHKDGAVLLEQQTDGQLRSAADCSSCSPPSVMFHRDAEEEEEEEEVKRQCFGLSRWRSRLRLDPP